MAFAVLAMSSAVASAQSVEDRPWLWVAPGFYGMEQTSCAAARSEAPSIIMTAVIHPELCTFFRTGNSYARYFGSLVKQHFTNVEDVFGAHYGDGVTPAVKTSGTLVVSLRLSRATFETVRRLASVDVFAPITLTLEITNVATGEVVFTKTLTDVREGSFRKEQVVAEISRQFDGHLRSVIDRLVTDAAKAFQPQRQSIPIVSSMDLPEEGKVYIAGAGRTSGLRIGDTIGLGARVVFAGADYAVVKASPGSLKVGDSASRFVSTPAQLLNRPTLLSVAETVPAGYSPNYLEQLFQDAASDGAALSPIPVNPSFSQIRLDALGSSDSTQSIDSRSLPEYIAVINIRLLSDAEFPSNIPKISHERYEAHAFVELIDNTGRILDSWHGKGAIEDTVAGSNRLSPFQRRDAVIRNAIKDAASQMASFKPRPFQVALRSRNNRFEIDDPTGSIMLNATLPVFRRIGRVQGVKSQDLLVPIGSVNPVEAQGGTVFADNAGPTNLNVRNGDLVAFEMAGMPVVSRSLLGQCADASGRPKGDVKGDVPVQLGFDILRNAMAKNGIWPVSLTGLSGLLTRYELSFATWNKLIAAHDRQFSTCFTPVVVAQSIAGAATISLAGGYTVRNGVQLVGSGGSQIVVTPTQLPNGTSLAAQQAVLQSDLAKFLPTVSAAAVKKLTSK